MPAARHLRGKMLTPSLKLKDGTNQTHPVLIYRLTFFVFCFFSGMLLYAQSVNLVPNGSFEERDLCIYNDSYVEDAYPWFNPAVGDLDATPDLFHTCATVNDDPCPYPDQVYLDPWFFGVPTNTIGCEMPYDGDGYAGCFFLYPNPDDPNGYREYLGIGLSQELTQGTTYYVNMALSLPERIPYAMWNIQVLFTPDTIVQNEGSYVSANPQLVGNPGSFIQGYDGWTVLSWTYVADGTERFMYIGNFFPNSETDTLLVLENDPEDHFGPASYYYIDDVGVYQAPLSVNGSSGIRHFEVSPNPSSGIVNLSSDNLISQVSVYDISGRLVKSNVQNDFSIELDLTSVSSGIYVIEAYFFNGNREKQKIVKQ